MVLLNYVLPLIVPFLIGYFPGKKMKTKQLAVGSAVLWLVFLLVILFIAPWGLYWIDGFTFSLTVYLGIIICLAMEVGFLIGFLKRKQQVKNARV